MKQKRETVSGFLVEVSIATRAAGKERPKIRAAKRKATSEAQAKMNAKYSWQKLERILAANFIPGDLVITLTYDDRHLPATRQRAQDRLKRFRKDLRDRRQTRGAAAVMAWNTENVSGSGRYHHHIVLNATGPDDFREILHCWPCGEDIEIRRLQVDREKNYESLARYMCKERAEKNKNTWSCTRNCKRPETESFPVPDDTEIQIPEDAIVLEDVSIKTEFGAWHYVKYLAAEPQPRRIKPRRRKQRTA